MKIYSLHIIIVFLLLSISNNICFSQFQCTFLDDFIDDSLSPPIQNPVGEGCTDEYNYAPYPFPSHTTEKTIRLLIHIYRKADGSGNFEGGTPQDVEDFFYDLIEHANNRMASIEPNNPAGTSPHIPDTKIRFYLDDIIYYNSTSLYNYADHSDTTIDDLARGDSLYQVILSHQHLSDTKKYHALHLLMLPGNTSCCSGRAKLRFSKEWIMFAGYDVSYDYHMWADGDYDSTIIKTRGHLIHEIGHSLGCHHSWYTSSSYCSDDGNPPKGTSNNYMDYTDPITSLAAFTECQIGKMHLGLMGLRGDISDCLIENYCTYNSNYDITINSGQDILWNSSKYIKGNIIIQNNAELQINCKISMNEGSKIEIQSGGKLVFDYGNIENACDIDNLWGTIEVQNGGYLEIDATAIRDYGIIVKSGGTLRITDELLVEEKGYINIESNAYLCIDTDADIELSNSNNVIGLFVGYHAGVHTYYVPDPGTCSANPASITIDGSGCICSCASDTQIQNETISSNRYICGDDIDIGYDVVSGATHGDVEINNNATVIINARGEVYIKNSFTADEGCELIIQ